MRGYTFLLASSCLGLSLLSFLWWQFHPWERLWPIQQHPFVLPLRQPLDLPTWTGTGSATLAFPPVTAHAVFVWEADTGTLLYQDHADLDWQPASTAKMMTAVVARQFYTPDTLLPVGEEANEPGSTANIRAGQTYSVHDLLYALLLPSGNDAAAVLANHYPGGETAFVDKMNTLATEHGLAHTMFANPSGLDAPQQYTTARDLAVLGKVLLADPLLQSIVSQPSATISSQVATAAGQTRAQTIELKNTDELLGKVAGIAGIKTGTTVAAGENLVTLYTKNHHNVVIVLLGSQNRYNEVQAILEWLTHFTWQTYGSTN